MAAAAVVGSLILSPAAPLLVAIVFVAVVPFEKLFPRHHQRWRRPGLGTDMAYAIAQPVLGPIGTGVALAVAVASLAWLPGLAIRPLVELIPAGPRALVGLAVFDLAIYWGHRWGHEVPFLWRFHSIHHSPERLDWITGFRSHPADGALLAPAFVFLLAAGFSEEFTGVLAVVQLGTGLFLHANVRWRWKPLHRVIVTPELHHWHHANERDARFTNYAAFLPVWDILFGTYFMPADRRPQHYGVDEPIPAGLAEQLWHPLRGLSRPWTYLRHPASGVRHLVRLTRRGVGQMWDSARHPRRTAVTDPGRMARFS